MPAAVAAMLASSPQLAGRMRLTRAINPLASDEWDDLISTHPEAGVFHHSAWTRVLNEAYGHAACHLARIDGDSTPALLPLVEVNSPLTGRRGVCLPFADECAPLTASPESGSALFQHALELGRERGWKHLEVRGEVPGVAPSVAWNCYVGHVLDLTPNTETLAAGLESSVRRALRKAAKSGLEILRSTTPEAMQRYYGLHCVTRKKHGAPPQPLAFFESIRRNLMEQGLGFIVEARCEGRTIASAVFLHYKASAIYKFGASDPGFLHLRGNDLVMWEAIKHCAASGCTRFSFGRSAASNEGLRRFKRGFGAKETALHYRRFDFKRNTWVAGREESDGWINQMFRLTPMPVFKMMGSALYRHLD